MNVIEVKNVSKKYRVYHDKAWTLKEKILFFNRTSYEERTVINDVSLSVKKGETVGLIGQNGSGKSTLLKLLTGIIYPDTGKINIKAKVSSLLELGAGFHPDFTGKENIYNNASIFGLSRKEIDKKYQTILDFSELADFIDNPVRTYSSGMYMRLAFSVAINVDAEILLIDEILAVGDANFQKKCFDKFKDLKARGTTIVIVTHDMGVVDRMCDYAVWLDKGKIMQLGNPRMTIDNYILHMGEVNEARLVEENAEMLITNDSLNNVNSDCEHIEENTYKAVKTDIDGNGDNEIIEDYAAYKRSTEYKKWGNKAVEILGVQLVDDQGLRKYTVRSGESISIIIQYKVKRQIENLVCGLGIYTSDRFLCYGTNTVLDRVELQKNDQYNVIEIHIPKLELVNGKYLLDIAVHSRDGLPYDYNVNVYKFEVYSAVDDIGVYRPEHIWVQK